MILNGVMALILRYFTEFSRFRGALCKSGWRYRRKKVHVRVSHLLISFLLAHISLYQIANGMQKSTVLCYRFRRKFRRCQRRTFIVWSENCVVLTGTYLDHFNVSVG